MQTPKNVTNIVELPESIFCEIFRRLYIETLYCKLRIACVEIQNYVDGCLKLKGIFILDGVVCHRGDSNEECSKPYRDARIIYIFKEHNKSFALYTSPPIGVSDREIRQRLDVQQFTYAYYKYSIGGSSVHCSIPFLFVYLFDIKTNEWYFFEIIPTHLRDVL